MVFIGICITLVFVAGVILREALLAYVAVLMLVFGHIWRNNTMMAYVENNAYDGSGKR